RLNERVRSRRKRRRAFAGPHVFAGRFARAAFRRCYLQHHRLHVGKWLQNAGGVSTYVPLLILVGVAGALWMGQGPVTHFTWANSMPTWNWDTVNFWSQIAFAFTGLELVSAMSAEIREPRKTLPRAALTAAALIAGMYIIGTVALLGLAPAADV